MQEDSPLPAAARPRASLITWFKSVPTDRKLERLGWGCWLTLLTVVSIMVMVKPGSHSVLWYYDAAASAWWTRGDLYSQQVDSFNYLPAFAVLFTPFHVLGPLAGGLLWRWISFAALTAGYWRLARLLAPTKWRLVLGLILFLAVVGSAGMLRNGQATTIMTALMIHASMDLAQRKWNRAALLLGLAVALKPLAIVLILLSAGLYRPMRARLAIAAAVVLLLPFLTAGPAYVLDQYGAMARQYGIAYGAALGPWSELGMMLVKFGLPLPPDVMTALRLAAALATLGLGHVACKRKEPGWAAFYVLGLAIAYLMLFNPANEENTYGALAGIVAATAALAFAQGRAAWIVVSLAVLCFALGSDGYGNLALHATKLWFKPAVCILFLGFFLPGLWRSDAGG